MQTEENPPQAPDVDERVEGDDTAGMPAKATPPIGDTTQQGQTQAPAPDDDVGVPPDEDRDAQT